MLACSHGCWVRSRVVCFPFKPDWPMQHPSVVIDVDDIEAAMAQVTAAGGEVMGEPMAVPGVGRYGSFVDTKGNRSSMVGPLA